MFIDLINNINNIINEDIPKFILNKLNINYDLFFNIINNNNIKNNTLNVFDFLDIINYINYITNTLENIHDHYLTFKPYIFLYIKQIQDLLLEYSINMQNDFILYFENANENETFNIFLLTNYIQNKNKNKIISTFYHNISEIKHNYYILKKNYNYDIYFTKLSLLSKNSTGINADIVKLYNFINNNNFDINKIKIKKDNIAQITHNDFYSVFNTGINNFLNKFDNSKIIQLKNKTIPKNNKYLKINDMLNIKNNEIFLYNYFYYYEILKKNIDKNKDNNTHNIIQVSKSIFDILTLNS
jgi:hypothetical protein